MLRYTYLNKGGKMKKKLFKILLLLVIAVSVTACGNNKKLVEIAKKINNCATVKSYKEYGYDIKATAKKDTLTVTTKTDDTKTSVSFKLEDNILSNDNIANEELLTAMLVIDAIGQTYGYEDGELSKNINSFPGETRNYTLAKEGFEIIVGEEKNSLKIDLSKKIPLIDMNKFYLQPENFDILAQIKADGEGGNQSGKSGNIAYDVFLNVDENTIEIGQDKKLSDSAYKSILSALEVMYDKEVANHFQEIYPKFIDGKKTIEAFTIETHYEREDKDESVFKDTDVLLIIINNKLIK